MSSLGEFISQSLDCGLLGTIAFDIVTNISHSMGNVAVGHTVGTGVRLNQRVQSNQPEQIQFNGVLLGKDRFKNKYYLELLNASKIPVPFISRLATLPLCSISGLLFSQRSDRRDQTDNLPVIDFSITLMETKTPFIVKQLAKYYWYQKAQAIPLDPARGLSNYIPNGVSNFDVSTSQVYAGTQLNYAISEPVAYENATLNYDVYIDENIAETIIDETINIDVNGDVKDDYADIDFTNPEWVASKNLDTKYNKLPFNSNENIPQIFKFKYPITPKIPPPDGVTSINNLQFNNISGLNILKHEQSGFYTYPDYPEEVSTTYTLIYKINYPFIGDPYIVLDIKVGDILIFSRKIISYEKYEVRIPAGVPYYSDYKLELAFIIPKENIGEEGYELFGGIRLIE